MAWDQLEAPAPWPTIRLVVPSRGDQRRRVTITLSLSDAYSPLQIAPEPDADLAKGPQRLNNWFTFSR